jgi:hypothetical protein
VIAENILCSGWLIVINHLMRVEMCVLLATYHP